MCSEGFCILSFVHKLSGRLGHQSLGALLIKCNFEQGIAAHRLYRYDQSIAEGLMEHAVAGGKVRQRLAFSCRGQ